MLLIFCINGPSDLTQMVPVIGVRVQYHLSPSIHTRLLDVMHWSINYAAAMEKIMSLPNKSCQLCYNVLYVRALSDLLIKPSSIIHGIICNILVTLNSYEIAIICCELCMCLVLVILLQNLAQSQRHMIGVYRFQITQYFGRYPGSNAAKPPAEFHSSIDSLIS